MTTTSQLYHKLIALRKRCGDYSHFMCHISKEIADYQKVLNRVNSRVSDDENMMESVLSRLGYASQMSSLSSSERDSLILKIAKLRKRIVQKSGTGPTVAGSVLNAPLTGYVPQSLILSEIERIKKRIDANSQPPVYIPDIAISKAALGNIKARLDPVALGNLASTLDLANKNVTLGGTPLSPATSVTYVFSSEESASLFHQSLLKVITKLNSLKASVDALSALTDSIAYATGVEEVIQMLFEIHPDLIEMMETPRVSSAYSGRINDLVFAIETYYEFLDCGEVYDMNSVPTPPELTVSKFGTNVYGINLALDDRRKFAAASDSLNLSNQSELYDWCLPTLSVDAATKVLAAITVPNPPPTDSEVVALYTQTNTNPPTLAWLNVSTSTLISEKSEIYARYYRLMSEHRALKEFFDASVALFEAINSDLDYVSTKARLCEGMFSSCLLTYNAQKSMYIESSSLRGVYFVAADTFRTRYDECVTNYSNLKEKLSEVETQYKDQLSEDKKLLSSFIADYRKALVAATSKTRPQLSAVTDLSARISLLPSGGNYESRVSELCFIYKINLDDERRQSAKRLKCLMDSNVAKFFDLHSLVGFSKSDVNAVVRDSYTNVSSVSDVRTALTTNAVPIAAGVAVLVLVAILGFWLIKKRRSKVGGVPQDDAGVADEDEGALEDDGTA